MLEESENQLKKNWIKIIIAIIIFIATISLGYYLIVLQKQGQKNTKDVSLQTKCENQTKTIFYDVQRSASNINYTYKNHYSAKLGRCYILIHGIGIGETGLSDILIDVFENKKVANCESYTTAPETDFCSYNGSAKIKYNIDQFNEFVKPYMEIE